MKTYLVDVMIRGQPGDATQGMEPVIAATRIAIQVPESMEAHIRAKAIGEEIRKVGAKLVEDTTELSDSIERFDVDAPNMDFSDVPPEQRPN